LFPSDVPKKPGFRFSYKARPLSSISPMCLISLTPSSVLFFFERMSARTLASQSFFFFSQTLLTPFFNRCLSRLTLQRHPVASFLVLPLPVVLFDLELTFPPLPPRCFLLISGCTDIVFFFPSYPPYMIKDACVSWLLALCPVLSPRPPPFKGLFCSPYLLWPSATE